MKYFAASTIIALAMIQLATGSMVKSPVSPISASAGFRMANSYLNRIVKRPDKFSSRFHEGIELYKTNRRFDQIDRIFARSDVRAGYNQAKALHQKYGSPVVDAMSKRVLSLTKQVTNDPILRKAYQDRFSNQNLMSGKRRFRHAIVGEKAPVPWGRVARRAGVGALGLGVLGMVADGSVKNSNRKTDTNKQSRHDEPTTRRKKPFVEPIADPWL